MKAFKFGGVFVLAWLLLPACQVALGDFTIDTSRLKTPCESNVTRCFGKEVQTCINGNEWKTLAECGSADLCNLPTQSCTPCRTGSYQCNGAEPEVCGADQKWTSIPPAPCASATLCVVPDDGSPANCVAAGCPVAGQLQCANGHLQTCPLTQTAWQDVEVCASSLLCDANAATAQVQRGEFPTCLLPACNAGQFNCDTGSPRPCKTDRTDWDAPTMSCTTGCNVSKGDCSGCSTGTYACSGTKLWRCDEQQQWTSTQCNSALSCNAGPTPGCDPGGVCKPGQFRCTDLSALERCRSDGDKWELAEQCTNRVLCNPNETRCEEPQCLTAGANRCERNELQHCRQDLTGWDDVMSCSDSGSCDIVNGCIDTRCAEGVYRCNDVTLEQCVNQVWTRKMTCPSSGLCNEKAHNCTAP